MTTPAAAPASTGTPPPPAGAGAPPPASSAGGAPPPPAAPTAGAGGTFLTTPSAGEGAKPPEGAKPDDKPTGDGAAAALEVKWNDAVGLSKENSAKFNEIAKELGLDSAKAQKLADLFGENASTSAKASKEREHQAAIAEVNAWNEAIKADPQMGGANLETTRKNAHAAVRRFASPEMQALMNQTGMGSHPEVVRTFDAIGRLLAEDDAGGNANGGAPQLTGDAALAASLYGPKK